MSLGWQIHIGRICLRGFRLRSVGVQGLGVQGVRVYGVYGV